ncbi:MAG: D-cysteine desulfhydrase family protein [bacterium]|nr:D-cysteine desulfhydrase family protein [bacterium]
MAQLPTPIHPLANFGRDIGASGIWIKRDDLTGLEGGGNKTRKLEYLVGDALQQGADMLVTAGAIQSNHTRQTAAAAARHGLRCGLLHLGWTEDAGPTYRTTGNILLSSLMGAELFVDNEVRPIEDQSPLITLVEQLKSRGNKPYLIPNGASLHPLGGLGYVGCAAEIVMQCRERGMRFDHVVHCTGSSSTQAGLLAGFAAMGETIEVIGIADDDETDIKTDRVYKLANGTLAAMKLDCEVSMDTVKIFAFDETRYGKSDSKTYDVIRQFARAEGLVVDPVYEGKAARGLVELVSRGRIAPNSNVLLMHLGGSPAVHAYAASFDPVDMIPLTQ